MVPFLIKRVLNFNCIWTLSFLYISMPCWSTALFFYLFSPSPKNKKNFTADYVPWRGQALFFFSPIVGASSCSICTVLSEILKPFSFNSACSCIAVVSSSFSICASTTARISGVMILGRPAPGRTRMEPVRKYFATNLPFLVALRPSLANIRATVYG